LHKHNHNVNLQDMLNNLLVLTTKEYYICQGTKYKTQV